MVKWMKVSYQEAQAHPLYGKTGWLAFFMFHIVMTVFALDIEINKALQGSGISRAEYLLQNPELASFATTYRWLIGVPAAGIFIMLFNHQQRLRYAAIAFVLLSWPILALSYNLQPFQGGARVLFEGFIPWVLWAAAWVSYLHLSRRVRVTFEHSVLAKDPILNLAQPFAASESMKCEKPIEPNTPETAVDEASWAKALAEFEGNSRQPGVWAKAFAESGGNESRAKAAYIKMRAMQLAREARECASPSHS